MIQIKLNGEKKELKEPAKLSEIVADFQFSTPYYAVALNRSVIPRSEHDQVVLKEGDEIEVVHAVGGG